MGTSKNYLAYIYLICATALWGGSIIAAKTASIIMLEPIKLSFYRNLVVIFILLPFVFNKLITNKAIYIKNWKLITLLSVLSVSIFNTFLNIALTTTSVISSSLMPAFTPALIILLSFLIYNSTITVFQSIGAVVSFFGFITIVLRGSLINLSQLDFVTGDLWMLSAVVCWAIYSVLLKKIPKNFDSIVFLFLIFFIGNLIVIPFYILESSIYNTFLLNEKYGWSIVLFVGIGPALISYLFWIKSVKIIGAGKSGLFLNLIPIFSGFISIIFLREILEIYHIIGAILIFTGIYLVTKENHNEKN